MRARRQLAVLIWVAIVAIAVQLMPTVAWAHGGHTHGPVATIEQPPTSSDIRSTAEHVTLAATTEMAEAAADARMGSASSGACHDSCCTSGFSCCVPGLIAESPPYLPAGMSGSDIIRPAMPVRAGIDPETLPKPPKSLS